MSCEKLLSLFCFVTPAFAMAELQDSGMQNPLVTSCFALSGGATTFFSDLIVWTAKEAGADCWAEVINTSGSSSSNDLKEVRFGWDPGFR